MPITQENLVNEKSAASLTPIEVMTFLFLTRIKLNIGLNIDNKIVISYKLFIYIYTQ
jgi:hypothetical protein